MKYCKSCGKPLDAGTEICPACGESVHQEAPENEKAENKKRPFYKAPIFIALIAVLLIGSAAVAAAVLIKSPKERYLLSEYKTFEKMKEEAEERSGDAAEFQDKMLEEPSETKVELSGDFEMDSMEGTPEYEMMKEILGGMTITMDMKQDPKEKKAHYSAAINLEDEQLIDAEMYQSDKQEAYSVPSLFDGYYYLNAEDYGDFMRMQNPAYDGPDEVSLAPFQLKDFELTEAEQEYLASSYGEFLMENLKDEHFSEEKKRPYEYEGIEQDLRKVTLKLSPKETKNLMDDFMTKLIKDEKLHDMIIDRMDEASRTSVFAENFGDTGFDKEEMEEELVQGLKDLQDEMKEVEYPAGFTSEILVDNKDYIVERTVKFAVDGGSEVLQFAVETTDVKDGDDKRYQGMEITAHPYEKDAQDDYKMIVTVMNDTVYKEDKSEQDMKISFVNEANGEQTDGIVFDMKSKFDGEKASKQKVNRDFSLAIQDGVRVDTYQEITGTIKQSNNTDAGKKTSKESFEIELDLADEYDGGGKLLLAFDSSSKLKDVKMPEIGKGDDTDLSKMTELDRQMMMTEIENSISDLMMEFGLMQMFMDPYSDDLYGDYSETSDFDLDDDYTEDYDFDLGDDYTEESDVDASDL